MNPTLRARLALLLCAGSCLAGPALAAETNYAWQAEGAYRPPSFDTVFPDNPAASQELMGILRRGTSGLKANDDGFALFHNGLRSLSMDQQTDALRWFGNAFIWNKSPQNPRAIDLMYHAAGSTNSIISYNAVYFGLSVVRPQTLSILRAMTEAALNSDDPNLISRVAWGGKDDKERLLWQLQPHLESSDPERRTHAEALRRIFSGELNAFAWADERARQAAQEKYAGQLENLRGALMEGNSTEREEAMDLIRRERINLIMDASFLDAFSAAAADPNREVREAVASMAGHDWVWKKANPEEKAIALMLRLSRDRDRQVRYNAMYYGLSTLKNRSDAVAERMLEMTLQDGMDNQDFRGRVLWGLESDKTAIRRVLQKWMDLNDPVKALYARGFYIRLFGEEPAAPDALAALLQTPDQIAGRILMVLPREGWKGESMDDFLDAVLKETPPAHASRVLWTNNQGPPFFLIAEDHAPAIRDAFSKSQNLRIGEEISLTVANLEEIGKEGGFKTLRLKPSRPRP